MTIWKIAVFRPLRRIFDYLPPKNHLDKKVELGVRVKIPMGHSQTMGILIGIETQTQVPKYKLKAVLDLLDEQSLFDEDLMQLNLWAAKYYQHPMGDVFCNSLPILLRQGKAVETSTTYQWEITSAGEQFQLSDFGRAKKQGEVLEIFKAHKTLSAETKKQFSISTTLLKGLEEKRLIQKVRQKSSLLLKQTEAAETKKILNADQAVAYQGILKNLNQFSVNILDGVTGSGKTEVYLQCMEKILQQNKQILVLVPEIGLTPQTLARFSKRFKEPIAVLHSNLSPKERLDAWVLARTQQIRIIIGTRSAIFSPLPNLGLIIIDEEHDQSFKQQEGFRYSARDLAIKRAQLKNIPVILGSATLSLETLYNQAKKHFHYFHLPKRAGAAALPAIKLYDMRNKKTIAGIAVDLIKEIEKHLQQNQQVLIFINRRGFAPTLICQQCGWIADCHRCDAHLTLHNNH